MPACRSELLLNPNVSLQMNNCNMKILRYYIYATVWFLSGILSLMESCHQISGTICHHQQVVANKYIDIFYSTQRFDQVRQRLVRLSVKSPFHRGRKILLGSNYHSLPA